MSKSSTAHASIDWDEQGQPLSAAFGDVYFSRTNGLAESRHVFIQHNQLPQRFAAMQPGSGMVVGETGFGTGLNFLACWQCFLEHAPADSHLHFVSVEKYPLQAGDLARALQLWPELAPLSQQLCQQYLLIQPGFQHLVFADGRISLTLLIGEASEQLAALDARVDAWLLDGFAPSKNPQMWTAQLFRQLARLSHPGTTLATFTSAGFVRRGLQDAGFSMQRQPGFGRKREMLTGNYSGTAVGDWQPPWFARPCPPTDRAKRALVIGAGISGCATAYSLARRGWQVCILERNAAPAMEASGNPQGLLYPKLSAHHTALSQLILASYGYTRRLLGQWPQEQDIDLCGLLQLAFDQHELKRQQQLQQAFARDLLQPLDSDQATALAGVQIAHPALLYPDSGWLKPASLCRLLLEHPRIELRCAVDAKELVHDGSQWLALGDSGCLASAPVAVIANAGAASNFSQCATLPLKAIHGQVSSLPATSASSQLRLALSGKGYKAPAHNGLHSLGASHNFDVLQTGLRPADHDSNLELLQQLSPQLYQQLDAGGLNSAQLGGHAAIRCSSPDYLPLIGPLACQQQLEQSYAELRKNARSQPQVPCPWLPGLYVNIAHGSRGMLPAPLAGEMLAAWICELPQVVPQQVATACHPNRFAIRALQRNQ